MLTEEFLRGLQPWTAEDGLCILDLMNLTLGFGIVSEIMHRFLWS
jgi:hypothetical protein